MNNVRNFFRTFVFIFLLGVALSTIAAFEPSKVALLSGSFWFSIDPETGDVEVWGDTQGSANVDEYELLIGLGSCSGDCMVFSEGTYEGTAFPTHDYPIGLDGSGRIKLHGYNATTNQGGTHLLATLKFTGTVCRDLYWRPSSDWYLNGNGLSASGTTGSTCD